MPQTATLPTGGGGSGFDNMSTPVKLGLIGGGIGLAFFLWRKSQGGGGGSSSNNDMAYGIPNTSVMLGSMQQELLDLKGQVGSGDAGLADIITGGFGNMGSQLDAQTAAFQAGLAGLQQHMLDNQNANTKSILDTISARSDVLAQLVATSSGAEQAAFQSFATSTKSGLDAIAAQQNAEAAAFGALGVNVSNIQAGLSGLTQQQSQLVTQLGDLQSQTTSQFNLLSSNDQQLATQLGTLSSNNYAMGTKAPNLVGSLNDVLLWSNTDQNYYYVERGHLYGVNWSWAQDHFDTSKTVRTDASLAYSVDAYLGN